jgi:hypothetical protein
MTSQGNKSFRKFYEDLYEEYTCLYKQYAAVEKLVEQRSAKYHDLSTLNQEEIEVLLKECDDLDSIIEQLAAKCSDLRKQLAAAPGVANLLVNLKVWE